MKAEIHIISVQPGALVVVVFSTALHALEVPAALHYPSSLFQSAPSCHLGVLFDSKCQGSAN